MGSRSSVRVAVLAATVGLSLSGCGSDAAQQAAPPAVSGSGSAAVPGQKVSTNTASEDEITAALQTAGVSNPGRWAEEVLEYRPYPADDPNLGKLRQNLAKYNPGQETENKIVSALRP